MRSTGWHAAGGRASRAGRGSRAAKFRHLCDEALGLTEPEISVLAVLMLRGPQTPGELKQRTERLSPFGSIEEVDGVLTALEERELVERQPRRPGQKEDRYAHLLGAEAETSRAPEADDSDAGDERLAVLEEAVGALRDEVAALRAELAHLRRRA